MNLTMEEYIKFDTVTPEMIALFDKYMLMPLDDKKKDDNLLPNIRKDDSFIPNIRKDDSFIPNIRKDDSFIPNIRKDDSFYPNKEDSLFWCLFIHKYKLAEFLDQKTKYKNRELDEKFKCVDYLKSNLNCLRIMRITKKDTQEIMGDLVTNKTTMFSLHGLCAFYNCNIIMVNKKDETFVEYTHDTAIDTCIIYKNNSLLKDEKSYYRIDLDTNDDKIREIREKYLKFESYKKPLKSISMYKLLDLESLANKMNIETSGLKKKEIYDAIYTKIL
jgi:hypothetical protein